MTSRLARLATTGLIAAAAASLIFAGATSASAKPFPFPQPGPQAPEPGPPAPTVTFLTNQSFVVPTDYIDSDQPLKLFGDLNLLWLPRENSRSYGVSVTCDDGFIVPMRLSYDTQGRHGAVFAGDIPVAEQGKVCTIHGTAPAGRSLGIGAPSLENYRSSTYDDVMTSALHFSSDVFMVDSTGGLG